MSNASIFEMTVFSLQFPLSPSAVIGYLIVFLIIQPEAYQIFATDMKKWRRDYPLTMRIGTSLCGGWCAYCWIDKVDQEEMEREIERGPQREGTNVKFQRHLSQLQPLHIETRGKDLRKKHPIISVPLSQRLQVRWKKDSWKISSRKEWRMNMKDSSNAIIVCSVQRNYLPTRGYSWYYRAKAGKHKMRCDMKFIYQLRNRCWYFTGISVGFTFDDQNIVNKIRKKVTKFWSDLIINYFVSVFDVISLTNNKEICLS